MAGNKKTSQPLVLRLKDSRAKNITLVGGKAASLAQLSRITRVPPAFSVTTSAYDTFINATPGLLPHIRELDRLSERWLRHQKTAEPKRIKDLEDHMFDQAKIIRTAVARASLPAQLRSQIEAEYLKLAAELNVKNLPVAVRSSGVAEDMPTASFAGQYSTYLNQRGISQVLKAVKDGFASQFTDRVVEYRNQLRLAIHKRGEKNGDALSHENCKIAVAVQAMINAQVAGVAFSIEPETGSPFCSIEVSWGLGEAIVAGHVTPDSYLYDPRAGRIVARTLGEKAKKTMYSPSGGTHIVTTSPSERVKFCLPDTVIETIGREIKHIADYYHKSVDVEFCFDTHGLWFLQARAETVASRRDPLVVVMQRKAIKEHTAKGTPLLHAGKVGSPGVGVGRVVVAKNVDEARRRLKKGDILVTDRTDPDWNPIFHLPSAVITNIGGANCHAAIVSREREIPCIVGSGTATKVFRPLEGKVVTVDAGATTVFKGGLPLEDIGENINVKTLLKYPTRTPIGLILSNPETARKMHALKALKRNFLISLLRIEFLLTDIGVHPRALADYDAGKIKDRSLRRKIAEKILGFKNGKGYYITKLSEGIAQFAAVFPDSPVSVRTTDFKTNEYGTLLGGELYESPEANPMMGYRGLIRSLHPDNHEVTRWELTAIRKVREMGYKNIWLKFPVVRDPIEITGGSAFRNKGYKGIFELMNEVGLKPGKDGLNVGVMVEVPTNAILIDKFLDTGITYISFGTNDLTQFTLAVDRDGNENIQSIAHYKEANPAVVELVKHVIARCRKRGVKTGICGQAPSNDPEFTKMLVEAGIGSIGVMPDRFLATYRLVKQAEQKLAR